MKEILVDYSHVLLETENPDFAVDEDDLRMRKRRLDFYLRNGMIDTGITTNVWHVEYKILAMPGGLSLYGSGGHLCCIVQDEGAEWNRKENCEDTMPRTVKEKKYVFYCEQCDAWTDTDDMMSQCSKYGGKLKEDREYFYWRLSSSGYKVIPMKEENGKQ